VRISDSTKLWQKWCDQNVFRIEFTAGDVRPAQTWPQKVCQATCVAVSRSVVYLISASTEQGVY